MTQRSLELLNQALALTEEERADLAASLLDSLDGPRDEDSEAAWQEEISKRISDLDSGKAITIPWEDVQKEVTVVLQHARKKR